MHVINVKYTLRENSDEHLSAESKRCNLVTTNFEESDIKSLTEHIWQHVHNDVETSAMAPPTWTGLELRDIPDPLATFWESELGNQDPNNTGMRDAPEVRS
ncbi:hypothetical protein Y032_0085g1816 [Ancylostoma ceylanicum]|uniref:Uncharacterized protein n=1 Tax=Ancylostoma ceylanicum TaxID=53326 RepID=A0A016TPX0_9BILA|nr:hypothetical protein Y032_0085g1816 [Ancylostoma ceylanicum]